MKNKPCNTEGCNNPIWAKGFCLNCDKKRNPDKYQIKPKIQFVNPANDIERVEHYNLTNEDSKSNIEYLTIEQVNEKYGSLLKSKSSYVSKNKQKDGKSIPELLKLATIIFNKWVRERDSLNGVIACISCSGWFKTGGYAGVQAGHFMPSTYSSLRFNEFNVNAECEKCNCHDPNHLIGYRKNLIYKIGLDKVLELESTPIAKYHKWERDKLLEIINKYK